MNFAIRIKMITTHRVLQRNFCGSVCGLYKSKQTEHHTDVHTKLLTGENSNGSEISFFYIIWLANWFRWHNSGSHASKSMSIVRQRELHPHDFTNLVNLMINLLAVCVACIVNLQFHATYVAIFLFFFYFFNFIFDCVCSLFVINFVIKRYVVVIVNLYIAVTC